MISIIPKFLLEVESVIELKDKGIKIEEGNQIIGKYKVPCYKVYNLSETEVFDMLEKHSLLEATSDSEKSSYANRVMSIIFLRLRQVNAIQDKDQRLIASISLLSAVNSLALIDMNYAKRFLPLLRSIS